MGEGGGGGSEIIVTCGTSPLLDRSDLETSSRFSEAPRSLSIKDSEPGSVEAEDGGKAPSRR